MQHAGPRLALKAFAQTGKRQPGPCHLGLCIDQPADPDVVALSGVTRLEDLGKILHE